MKLRYRVDQAYCFRHGIDMPESIHVVDVDPIILSQEDRNLIADRLNGIDVLRRAFNEELDTGCQGCLIKAQQPGLQHLLEACQKDEDEYNNRLAP